MKDLFLPSKGQYLERLELYLYSPLHGADRDNRTLTL